MQSLQQQKKNSSKLKNLLLLLLRLLALGAIVCAFAYPYITPNKVNMEPGSKPQVVIYIDNSFSMSNTGSKGSLLEEAKKQSFDIISTYPAGTGFTLLTNDHSNDFKLSKEEIINALGSLKTTPSVKKLSEIYKETGELTDQKRTTLFLLSDFQKSNCDFQSFQPDTLIESIFLVLKPENLNNLYIKDVSFPQPFHQKNQNDEISITLVNSSDKDYNNVPVSLTINDKKKSVNKVNIPANGEESLTINYQNTEDGFYRGVVEVSDFPVVFDNKFYFSYGIDSKVHILCIEQNVHTPFFQKLFSDTTAFELSYVNVNQTSNINFNAYNLIILDQIASSWTGLESALETYVNGGGNLFILPGEQVSVNVLNKLLQKMHVSQFGAADTNSVISHIESESAIFKDVFEKQDDNHVLPQAKRFYRLNLLNEAEKLLSDKRGNTVLSAQSSGKGNVYISAFDYTPENSDMVYHPLFVPIMVNMAYNINGHLNSSWFLNSGKQLNINSKNVSEDAKFLIRDKANTFEFIPEIRKDFSGNFVMTNPQDIRQAGLYDVMQNDKLIDVLACNYDRTESNLSFCSEEELEKHFPQAKIENIKTTQLSRNSELVKEIVLQDNNRYLSSWFVLLAVIVFLLEQWVWKRKLM